jgi:hypothetical protein
MFLTSIGAAIAICGSLLVLAAIALSSMLRAAGQKQASPQRSALQVDAYRLRAPVGKMERVA